MTSHPPPGLSARRAAFGGQLTSTDANTSSASSSTGSNPKAPATSASTPNATAKASASGNASSSSSHQRPSKGKARSKPSPAKNSSRTSSHKLNPASNSFEGILAPSQAAIDAAAAAAAAAAQAGDDAEQDEEICLICADVATFWAVGMCNHRTCHTCSIRLRALYKKKECTLCKTECDRVVFTTSPDRPYSDYPEAVVPFSDAKLGISFETREQMDDSLALLRFNCPVVTCESICLGWSDLKRHVRSSHSMNLCDLCCSNKKIFAHEHSVYSPKELNQHIAHDHQSCEFCRRAFYDADQLYAHCRDAHEECFICVRQGIRHQYHLNYAQLEAHYKAVHFLCPHPNCLEKKFVVFETELDLQAHAVQEHGAALAGDQRTRRDARRIETNFTYEGTEPSTSGIGGRGGRSGARGGRRGGRGGANDGAGRESGVTAAFVQTTDAPNRSRIIPGLGPSSTNGTSRANRFGSALTNETNGGNSSAASSGRATPDPGTVERHAHVMRLVTDAVHGSDAKVTSFKLAIRAFRANEVSADDLVDQLWNIFDQNVEVAGPIVTGVAELMEDGDKKASLHGAWRDRRIEQNQFPSLTALAPTLHGVPTTTHNSSPRALNSRATRNQRDPSIWARVEQAANRPTALVSANPFPALSSARNVVPGMAPRQPATGVGHHTPWSAAASTGPSTIPSTSTATPRYTSPSPSLGLMPPLPSVSSFSSSSTLPKPTVLARPPKTGSGAEFPSLPVSMSEMDRRARIRAAMGKPSQTILDTLSPPIGERSASPWSPSGSGASTPREGEGIEPEPDAGRKKKKGKVLLMSHGVHRG